jgi:hypothetical protein
VSFSLIEINSLCQMHPLSMRLVLMTRSRSSESKPAYVFTVITRADRFIVFSLLHSLSHFNFALDPGSSLLEPLLPLLNPKRLTSQHGLVRCWRYLSIHIYHADPTYFFLLFDRSCYGSLPTLTNITIITCYWNSYPHLDGKHVLTGVQHSVTS